MITRARLAVLAAVLLVPLAAGAQDVPRVRVAGTIAGQIVTLKNKIYAGVPADSPGVEFFFTPEARDATPILLGRDRGHMERTYGPDCGEEGCRKRVFSVKLGRQIKAQPEGWGLLTVRDVGTGEQGSVRVYWDDFAQHAACVPTTVGANLQWLQDTGQADVVNPVYDGDPKALVSALGLAMQTTPSGTSGADSRDGTAVFLLFTAGLLAGQDYTLDHLGSGDADGTYGFTPEQMIEQLQAGGAVSLGFHNLASDASFGHFLALTNVVLNPDGTAWIVVMDPNVEPNPGGQTSGEYRWFKLHTNGKLDWTAANPGYYSPASGKVKLDELLILRDFPPPSLAAAAAAAEVPTSGEVPGRLSEDGHTFEGTFVPPEGSPGPWLLVSESTHAAGHTQRAYRYVGGKFGTGPD